MPGLTRVGDLESGHDGYEPVRLATGSPNVCINGRRAGRVGDVYEAHGGHRDVIVSGSPRIFINGRPAARVGDSVAGAGGTGTVAQGSGNVFCGEDSDISRINAMDIVWQIFMRRLRKTVDTSGTPTDKLLLCLPRIAASKAYEATDAADCQGWSYLHDMFQKWFGGIANTEAASNDPFWVDIEWVLSYIRARTAFNRLLEEEYLFSIRAQNVLAKILQRDGYFSQGGRKNFDYTDLEWQKWKDTYFQRISVNEPYLPVDGLTAALGAFNFWAIARRGYVESLSGGQIQGFKIVIQSVSVVVRDSFDFEGWQYLGVWKCSPPSYSSVPMLGYTVLQNNDFQNFRIDFGMGGDFLVLSEPKHVDLEEEFSYVWYP